MCRRGEAETSRLERERAGGTVTADPPKPHAYEMGKVNFRGVTVKVDERVLVPRRESGLLVEVAVQMRQCSRIHEVGTGSGAIAKAIKTERPDLIVTGSDVSAEALELAKENLEGLRVQVWEGSMLNLPGLDPDEDLDLIVANLPYITDDSARTRSKTILAEPAIAVFDDSALADDGLGLIRQLIGECDTGQRIALEHDTHHGPALREMLHYAVTLRDQDGNERMTTGVVF